MQGSKEESTEPEVIQIEPEESVVERNIELVQELDKKLNSVKTITIVLLVMLILLFVVVGVILLR